MRILSFVPESLPTHRADVAILAAKYLPRHGIYSHFIGRPGLGDQPSCEAPEGVKIELSGDSRHRLGREFNYLRLAVSRLLSADQASYNFIQVRDMVSIACIALAVARRKCIPFIYWMSFLMCEARTERARQSLLQGRFFKALMVWAKARVETWLLYKVVLPRATHIFVQSDAMRRYLVGRGIPGERMEAVPMGFDLEVLDGRGLSGRRLPKCVGKPLIGYLGTLDAQRKIEVLVDALSVVRRAIPSAQLLLIGGADSIHDIRRLEGYAKKRGLEDAVFITGWMTQERAWELLVGCDVCVSPVPRGEILDTGSPTKLVEYMAFGMPCVGNDNPDQRNLLEDSSAGWLVAGESPDYSGAIIEILNDVKSAREKAAHGPAYVARVRSYAALSAIVAASYKRLGEM
jgi:glycosyltransferase involved in cell wall biosynthesis